MYIGNTTEVVWPAWHGVARYGAAGGPAKPDCLRADQPAFALRRDAVWGARPIEEEHAAE